MENVLDQGLKGGGGICEAKWHHLVLVVTIARAEGGLFDVILMNADLIVSPSKINFGEDFCTK